jgi:hypothetical protein
MVARRNYMRTRNKFKKDDKSAEQPLWSPEADDFARALDRLGWMDRASALW